MPPLKHNSVRDCLSDSDRFSDISSSSPSPLSEKQQQQQFVTTIVDNNGLITHHARLNISTSTKRELASNNVKKIADNLPGFSDWRQPLSPSTTSPGSSDEVGIILEEEVEEQHHHQSKKTSRLPIPTTRRTQKKQQQHHHRKNSSTSTSSSSNSKDNYSVIDYSNMKDYVSFTPNNSNSSGGEQRNIRDMECDILSSQPQKSPP